MPPLPHRDLTRILGVQSNGVCARIKVHLEVSCDDVAKNFELPGLAGRLRFVPIERVYEPAVGREVSVNKILPVRDVLAVGGIELAEMVREQHKFQYEHTALLLLLLLLGLRELLCVEVPLLHLLHLHPLPLLVQRLHLLLTHGLLLAWLRLVGWLSLLLVLLALLRRLSLCRLRSLLMVLFIGVRHPRLWSHLRSLLRMASLLICRSGLASLVALLRVGLLHRQLLLHLLILLSRLLLLLESHLLSLHMRW